jgi:hypothetical protein
MLRTTIRRDLRWRLLAAAVLVAMPLGLVALGLLAGGGREAARDYLGFLDGTWYHLPGGSAIFLPVTLLLAASGTLAWPARDVAYQLSLPVSRRRWVLAHVAAAAAALALLVAASGAVFAAIALRNDIPVPVAALLARTLLVFLAAAAWIGPMTVLMVLVRRPIIGVTLAFVTLAMTPVSRFMLEVPAKPTTARLPVFDPFAFADPRAWAGTIPFASVASAIAIGVGGTLVAIWLFGKIDY